MYATCSRPFCISWKRVRSVESHPLRWESPVCPSIFYSCESLPHMSASKDEKKWIKTIAIDLVWFDRAFENCGCFTYLFQCINIGLYHFHVYFTRWFHWAICDLLLIDRNWLGLYAMETMKNENVQSMQCNAIHSKHILEISALIEVRRMTCAQCFSLEKVQFWALACNWQCTDIV